MAARVRTCEGAGLAILLAVITGAGCSKISSTAPLGGGGGVASVVNVTGKVIAQNGQVMAGVPVAVTGMVPANTDAGGNFSFPNVTAPYDISVVNPATNTAIMYKGLSRADPTLLFFGFAAGGTHTGGVNGRISGGTFTPNQGASDVTRVVFASPSVSGRTTATAPGTFGPITMSWFGPAAITGTLFALQYTVDASGLPAESGYRGYGSRAGIAVNDGTTLNDLSDSLQAVATNQFSGTVTVPAGYNLVAKALYVRVSPSSLIQIVGDATPNTAPGYYTPEIPLATLLLGVQINRPGGGNAVIWKSGLPTSAIGIPIDPVSPPELSAPADGSGVVDTTVTFSWIPPAGAVHVVSFLAGTTHPAYYVVTAGTSVTIPNLKLFGLGLPPSTFYTWGVLAVGPFDGIDAATGPSSFVASLASPPVFATGDVLMAQSSGRTFLTAP